MKTSATRSQKLHTDIAHLDPLDRDQPTDARLTTTRRRLIRLVLVAAETGARFEREGIEHDPVAWLMAPRLLFDGRDAVTACGDLEACSRAIVLHGLSLGLDADPDVIDDLLDDGSAAIDQAPAGPRAANNPDLVSAEAA